MFVIFVHALDVGIIDSVPFFIGALGLLHFSRKSTAKSHSTYTAAMNQGSGFDIDDIHQALKYTKAKMCEILVQIAPNQEDHRQPSDAKVSIVWDFNHLLGLIASSHSQCLPITARSC